MAPTDPQDPRAEALGKTHSGALWINDPGESVFETHDFGAGTKSGTPLGDGNRPTEDGTIAAGWDFEVTGSSGDDWDDVVAGGTWTFDLQWGGGNLFGLDQNTEALFELSFGDIFFSHKGGMALGEWVLNNNSDATPGATVDPVWTYLAIDPLDPLTGATGRFFVIADDADDVVGLQSGLGRHGTNAAFIDTAGSGELRAEVPVPATLGLLAVGLMGMGLFAGRRRNAA